MNRLNGITNERVLLCYENKSYGYDSFQTAILQKNNHEQLIRLPDWIPMLESKGFTGMVNY